MNIRILSPRLEYPQEVAESLGMKHSSLVSRVPSKEKPIQDTESEDYDIFDQDFDCQPLKELPHPRQLLSRKRCKEEKKRIKKISTVDQHVAQLRRKRAKLEELKGSSADTMSTQNHDADTSHDVSSTCRPPQTPGHFLQQASDLQSERMSTQNHYANRSHDTSSICRPPLAPGHLSMQTWKARQTQGQSTTPLIDQTRHTSEHQPYKYYFSYQGQKEE